MSALMSTLTLLWLSRDLSPNARVHWARRSKAARQARHEAQRIACRARLGITAAALWGTPESMDHLLCADTAQKTAERNDYSVFQLWGLGEDQWIDLSDLIRGQWEVPDLKQWAIDFWNAYRAYDHRVSAPIRWMNIEE